MNVVQRKAHFCVYYEVYLALLSIAVPISLFLAWHSIAFEAILHTSFNIVFCIAFVALSLVLTIPRQSEMF